MKKSVRNRFATLTVIAAGISACADLPLQSSPPAGHVTTDRVAYLTALPNDIDPDSRSRLPIVDRDELDDAGKAIFDRYMSPDSSSLAGIQGPGGIRLHQTVDKSPSRIDKKTEELVRLVVAREMDHQFEWTMHEPVALAAGVDSATIDIIRLRKPVAGTPEKEAAIIALGREVFQQHEVSPDTYARALQQLGKRDLIAVTELMGRGVTSMILLSVFDLRLPYDREPLLPER